MSSIELETKSDDKMTECQDTNVKQRTWRSSLIGLIFFLHFCGSSMSLFVVTQYIYRRLLVDVHPNATLNMDQSFCTRNNSDPRSSVQEKAANYNIIFSLFASVPSVITNILIGSYTDKYGRKFLMIFSMTGTLLGTVISIVGVYTSMNLDLFAIAFAVEGIAGHPFSMLLAGYSYVADITSRKERPFGIVLLEVCLGLGTTIPTVLVGYFLESTGYKIPLIVSVCFIIVAIMLCILVLPESFPSSKRTQEIKRCANLKHVVEFYVSPSNAGKRWKYIICILVFCCTMLDILGRNGVETLYQMNAPFCWTPKRLGWFGGLKHGLQQVFGMLSVRIFKIFLEDDSIAMIGCVSYAAGFLLEAFAKTDVMIYIVTVVGAFGLLTVPMMRSIMSRMTSSDKQGAVAASIATADNLCKLTSHVIFVTIYKRTLKNFAGTVFIVMAGFNAVSFILIAILKIGSRGQSYDDEPKPKEAVRTLAYIEKS